MEIAIIALVVVVIAAKFTIKIVPQQNAWIVERLGKYEATLSPGFNAILPFVDRVAYKHSLKEIPLDVPSQVCITRDNTQLQVDGILYFQVTDPMRAIKDLTPPAEILRAMQAQITAEREKRAVIATSEGKRQEQINLAEGQKQAAIAKSEGEKQAQINNAQGEAAAITEVANATAAALMRVAEAIRQPGGQEAVQLKVAEKAVDAYSRVAFDAKTTLVVPSNMTEVSALISSAMKMVQANKS